jgi:hypothetical protein
LIDWGLSTIYLPNKTHPLPKTWHNRPFQYNAPFSIVLFSDKFTEKYKSFLDKNKKVEISENMLKTFIRQFIYYWLKERGSGHFKFINSIMYKLFFQSIPSYLFKMEDKKIKNKFIEKNVTIPYIMNYLYVILINYTQVTKNNYLVLDKYLNEVFIKIIDVYGFIISYYPFLEIYYDNYDVLTPNELEIFNKLKKIFIKYLYEPTIQPISIVDLTNDIKSLNPLFKLAENLHAKSFHIMSKSFSHSKIYTQTQNICL